MCFWYFFFAGHHVSGSKNVGTGGMADLQITLPNKNADIA